jgi:polyisoprenyl-phosphate glycosyltransferase
LNFFVTVMTVASLNADRPVLDVRPTDDTCVRHQPMKISVVVPCYNEEEVLPLLFKRLSAAADQWGIDYEIICVSDGSHDRTWELLKSQNMRDGRWRCIHFARNFGHQAAVSAGLYHVTGDVAVILDADLQDPPECIVELIAKWREGYDVVAAVRLKRKDPLLKSVLAWAFYRVMKNLASCNIPTDSGDYCLLDRKVVNVLNSLPERNRYLRGLRAWSGFRQTSLAFERQPRAAGEPLYTFRKSLKLALDGIFSFSTVPLRLITHLGLWVSGLSFLGALTTLFQKIFAVQLASFGLQPGPGFPTIVIAILFLGGVQLVCLGILGEYLGRVYEEVKGRPQWIIQDSVGFEAPPVAPRSPLTAIWPTSNGT